MRRAASSLTRRLAKQARSSTRGDRVAASPHSSPPRSFRRYAQIGAHNGPKDASSSSSSTSSSSSSPPPPLFHPTEPLSSVLSMNEFAVPRTPDRMDLNAGQRLVAIGDVHGDLDQLRKFLVVAKVLDPNSTVENPKWIGGNSICVQTGDVLDRGDRELACFKLLIELARQARESGGALSILYGNHEALNVEGLFSYAWKEGNAEFEREIGSSLDSAFGGVPTWRTQFAGNEPARWASMEPGGLLSGPLLSDMKVAMVVGRSVLVHGGLTPSHLEYHGGGIEEMNHIVRDWVSHVHHGGNNNEGRYASVDELIKAAQARVKAATESMPKCLGGDGGGSGSPVWIRVYSYPPDAAPQNEKAQEYIDAVLADLDADRMIMGHTPQDRINAALRSKAWRIDVGAAKGMGGGTVEVLEVVRSNADSAEEEVWILTESERIPGSERQSS